MKKFLLLITVSLFVLSFNQNNCEVMREGKFLYINSKSSSDYFTISGNNHIEYLNQGKFYIKSKIEWVSDCEYNLTMKKIKYPNFPFKKGDVLNVKVLGGKGDTIFYRSKIKDLIQNGRLIKID